MRTLLNKTLFVCCLIILVQSYAIGNTSHSCEKAQHLVSDFVDSKKNTAWDRIESNVYKLQDCKCDMAPVFYYIYRMKTLLPNSQVLVNKSPNDFVNTQKLKMHEQITILRQCNMKHYLPLINTMINQNFDSEIANSAKALKKKLHVKSEGAGISF